MEPVLLEVGDERAFAARSVVEAKDALGRDVGVELEAADPLARGQGGHVVGERLEDSDERAVHVGRKLDLVGLEVVALVEEVLGHGRRVVRVVVVELLHPLVSKASGLHKVRLVIDGSMVLGGAVVITDVDAQSRIFNLRRAGYFLARVEAGEVNLVRSLVLEVGIESLLQAGNAGVDELAQVADRPDDTSRVEELGIAIGGITVAGLRAVDLAREMRTGDLVALCFVERGPAHLVSAPKEGLLETALV